MTEIQGVESTIEHLENDHWPEAPEDATRLVKQGTALRKVPITELSAEDLRLLLGQRIGVCWILPKVLLLLTDDPLVEGDLYPGDLLVAVLNLPCWNDSDFALKFGSQILKIVKNVDIQNPDVGMTRIPDKIQKFLTKMTSQDLS